MGIKELITRKVECSCGLNMKIEAPEDTVFTFKCPNCGTDQIVGFNNEVPESGVDYRQHVTRMVRLCGSRYEQIRVALSLTKDEMREFTYGKTCSTATLEKFIQYCRELKNNKILQAYMYAIDNQIPMTEKAIIILELACRSSFISQDFEVHPTFLEVIDECCVAPFFKSLGIEMIKGDEPQPSSDAID